MLKPREQNSLYESLHNNNKKKKKKRSLYPVTFFASRVLKHLFQIYRKHTSINKFQ